MSDDDTIHVVMSDPPELGASHPVEAWSRLYLAEERAEEISFGYVKSIPLDDFNGRRVDG